MHGAIDNIPSPSGNDDLRPFFREQTSSRLADPAIAAGDDGDLVFEVVLCLSPFDWKLDKRRRPG
ncbi:hypothetical protein [Sinorhizobium meliloti]|uniref:hypothetical protein n=1 Tax=Rhizobium meliloti TaxID=382 RepID=UPI00307E13F5